MQSVYFFVRIYSSSQGIILQYKDGYISEKEVMCVLEIIQGWGLISESTMPN